MRRSVVLAVAVLTLWSCTEGSDPVPGGTPSATSTPTTSDQVRTSAAEPLADDRVVFDSNRTGTFEVFTMAPDGSDPQQVTDDDEYDSWWARLSPDRTRILFYRTPAGVHDRDFEQTSLWLMASDGTGLVELRPPGTDGWAVQGHAEWSPDGEQLVMFGGDGINPQIHVTDAVGADPQAITSDGGQNIDPSFRPDGKAIVYVGCPRSICFGRDYEIYEIPVDGGERVRLTEDDLRDQDPYYAPDGGEIAWLTQTGTEGPVGRWDIRAAEPDGSGLRRITDDEHINSKPEWSRDGDWILFHRLELGEETFSIFRIRPDGTELQELTAGQPGVNEYPGT